TITNDSGNFRFELLPASLYEIKITKTGFGTVVQRVELLLGTTASVNPSLRPGATGEIVEVTAGAPLVDTEKTGVSQSVTPSQVEDLPLVGRDAANLAYLVPGVKAADSYDPTKNRYAVLAINGSDGRNVNTTVNGIDNKDNTVGGAVMQLPLEGGPFVRDKLFGFFAIERERESQAQAVAAQSYAELVLAQQAGLAAQPSKTIPRPFYETRYNGRMDWTINHRNTAYLSYSSQA